MLLSEITQEGNGFFCFDIATRISYRFKTLAKAEAFRAKNIDVVEETPVVEPPVEN